MKPLLFGQHVQVKRTNGRIHQATVMSELNEDGRSIKVAWFEQGEIKYEEVEMEAILSLNPEVMENCEQHAAPACTTHTSRIAPSSSNNFGNRTSRLPVRLLSGLSAFTDMATNSKNLPPPPPPTTGIVRSRTTAYGNRLASAATNGINPFVGKTASAPNISNNSSSAAAVPGRQTYVVRARQAEIKKEINTLMPADRGNPNWEIAEMIREYQNTLKLHSFVDEQAIEDHRITVCVRKRPLSRKELTKKEVDVVSVTRNGTIIVHEPRTKVDLTKYLEHHPFRFDYALNEHSSNFDVYKCTAEPLVKTIFEGGAATCFAYGQTGAGKTHTMGGYFLGKVQDCKNGIYAMAAKDIFNMKTSPRYASLNLVVFASFFEIYSGKVFDLLADKKKLRVLEDGEKQVQVKGLTENVVADVDEVLKLIAKGNLARTSGQTLTNSNSSRSHAVFQIVLRPSGGGDKIHGKFSFIDLAGNEPGADTSSNEKTRQEGREIRKSLFFLRECIRALGGQAAHLPFRSSKLTQVLRDSFIGAKSKTCMIAMISPGLSACEQTLNTLRYADLVKQLVVEQIIEEEQEHEDCDDENDRNAQQTEQMDVDQHRANYDLIPDLSGIMNYLKSICKAPETLSLDQAPNVVDYVQQIIDKCKQGQATCAEVEQLATEAKKIAEAKMLCASAKPPGKR